MKTTKAKILTGMVLLISLMLITGIVWAKANRYWVTGGIEITPDLDGAKKVWTDAAGILHIQRMPVHYVFSGSLVGEGDGEVNLTLDEALGDGKECGSLTCELTWGDLTGTFKGSFSVKYTGGSGFGRGAFHGKGDFAGMSFLPKFTIESFDLDGTYTAVYDGALVSPHD